MHDYYNSSIRKKYVSCESRLDYKIYHTSYESVKYLLNDLIVQHNDGYNLLFIQATLKEINQVVWSKI